MTCPKSSTKMPELRRPIFGCSFGLVFFFILATRFTPSESTSEELLSNISIRLYLGKTADDGNFADEFIGSASELLQKMDPNKPTAFYIHGFSENLNRTSVHKIVNGYLQREDHNVLTVDWSEIAGQNYVAVALSAPDVGKTLAGALNRMVENSFDSTTLHVIGHSLGGQIAGHVGRNVDFTIPRITGLDPAGPGFNVIIRHLSSKDAKFVDIIHTDAGVYGFLATGHVDFWPNGGHRIQPGCPVFFVPLDNNDFCSHHRSWEYYAESLADEKAFVGLQCSGELKFRTRGCKSNKEVPMGIATPTDTRGSFFLETNKQIPFGRSVNGTNPRSILPSFGP